MDITEIQELEFRAVASSLRLSVEDIALTRDTLEDFIEHQGNPKDIGKGYFYWDSTTAPRGSLLVKDFGKFRAAFFQAK